MNKNYEQVKIEVMVISEDVVRTSKPGDDYKEDINYLLNVGPDALGRIPAPSGWILREVGERK